MDEQEFETKSNARINCTIRGSSVQTLKEMKRRGIAQSNREAVVQAFLAMQERITKSDIDKTRLRNLEDKVHLKPWDEVIGILNATETTELGITILLTCTMTKSITITIPKETPQQYQQLQRLSGRKIAIMRTDNPQKPYKIRILETKEPTKTQKQTRQQRDIFLHRFCCSVVHCRSFVSLFLEGVCHLLICFSVRWQSW